jgi:hypothetical protein
MDMYDHPDCVHQLLAYCTKVATAVSISYLDSATCAACGYITVMVKNVVESFSGRVDWVECKGTKLENIVRVKQSGI